ncbi:hypothetical protein AFE_1138 [Acidithiobacillus ferrooxidans ATCC 23270]|uniref:Uncharacterized protein n=1 Tax=Acidithiobacillus ferrooxidans (strain ATCC 23270 / DSM 14882 / CIP 104768 / NCIMB 8455) TaxID=243159 RepID=B7J886_ACIF2|nr:hypothetical protein AFE_1138 [Acidithiobacillus ferrooxidans ATCC 23270]
MVGENTQTYPRPSPDQVLAWRPKDWCQTKDAAPHWLVVLRNNGALTIDNLERAMIWAKDEEERAEIAQALEDMRLGKKGGQLSFWSGITDA